MSDTNKSKKITVTEVFGPTMQGEGALAGCITTFVRTGGCDFLCAWCLGPNTQIVLASNKRKKIKDIVVGDVLIGYDEKTGTLQPTVVTATLAHEVEELYTLETGNTEKSKTKVVCSGDHMWMTRDRGWAQTRDLTTDDVILSVRPGISDKEITQQLSNFALNGMRVKSVKPLSNKAKGAMWKSYEDGVLKMYDIKCEPYPTFFANGMLTHNCDSLHAVLPKYARQWQHYTTAELIDLIAPLTPRGVTVTLSGGNPALQPFEDFILTMQSLGNPVVMETQGSHFATWMRLLDHLVLSPKPPSSGMTTDFELLDKCINSNSKRSLKVVVMSDEDYDYARQIYRRYLGTPFFLSVGNPNPPAHTDTPYGTEVFEHTVIVSETERLIKKISETKWEDKMPRLLPQVHTLLWGNRGGV